MDWVVGIIMMAGGMTIGAVVTILYWESRDKRQQEMDIIRRRRLKPRQDRFKIFHSDEK